MQKTKYLIHPIFSTGDEQRIKIKKIFKKTKSDFQNILIADFEKFGKCLVIDGIMQSCVNDHEIYDREILKLLRKGDRRLLILGGGDGYVAETAFKINPKLNIEVIEIDAEIVKNCVKSFDQKVFNDPRVKLRIGDALQYLQKLNKSKIKAGDKFDGIVCDFTGIPVEKKDKKKFEDFYKKIITPSSKILKEDGWIALLVGVSKLPDNYLDGVKILKNLTKKYFKKVSRSDVFIESYGEEDAFLFCKK